MSRTIPQPPVAPSPPRAERTETPTPSPRTGPWLPDDLKKGVTVRFLATSALSDAIESSWRELGYGNKSEYLRDLVQRDLDARAADAS